jgi:hypothetical protein
LSPRGRFTDLGTFDACVAAATKPKRTFAEELAKAASAAEEIEAQPAAAPPLPVTDRNLMLAEPAPIGLVLQSWMEIEGAMADAVVRHGLAEPTKSGNPRSVPSYPLDRRLGCEADRAVPSGFAEAHAGSEPASIRL